MLPKNCKADSSWILDPKCLEVAEIELGLLLEEMRPRFDLRSEPRESLRFWLVLKLIGEDERESEVWLFVI